MSIPILHPRLPPHIIKLIRTGSSGNWQEDEQEVILSLLEIYQDIPKIKEILKAYPIGYRIKNLIETRKPIDALKDLYTDLIEDIKKKKEESEKELIELLETKLKFIVERIEIIPAENPIYRIWLDIGSLKVFHDEFRSFKLFANKFAATFYKELPAIDQKDWLSLIKLWYEKKTKIVPDAEESTLAGNVRLALDHFIRTNFVDDQSFRSLVRGKVIEIDNDQHMYLCLCFDDFRKYLDREKVKVNNSELFSILRDENWESKPMRREGIYLRVWRKQIEKKGQKELKVKPKKIDEQSNIRPTGDGENNDTVVGGKKVSF